MSRTAHRRPRAAGRHRAGARRHGAEHHLELTLKLATFGRPLVIALNKMDEAEERGIYVNARELSVRLGAPVVPTAAIKGHGIAELFRAAVHAVREGMRPHAQPPSSHITAALELLGARSRGLLEIQQAFRVPLPLLLTLDRGGRSVFSR